MLLFFRSTSPTLFVLLIGLLLARGLSAQIVNIEDKRQRYDTTGWFGQVDLGLNWVRNTKEILTVSTAARIDRVGPQATAFFIGNYHVVRAGEENFINDGFAHLRYDYALSPRLSWEAFNQWQYNERIQLQLRLLLGTGPRWALLERERVQLYVGTLYMYEYDEFSQGEIYYRDHRLSAYLSGKLDLAGKLHLANTTYYQPLLPGFELPRVSSVTTVALALTRRLSLNSRLSFTYDGRQSRDVPDVPAALYNWVNGIRWNF